MRNTVQRTKQNLTAETIVMTKWIGLKGSALIARKREKDLLTYFSPCFVDRVKEFDRLTAPGPEEEIFREMGIDCFRETGDGGVYGALWDMAEERSVGIDVSLKDIPVKQETIEIANFLDFDPYLLLSFGSFLIFTDRGYELVRRLKESGIPAAIIGVTTDSNDRVVTNNGNTRFLSPRYRDEINKVLSKEQVLENG